MTIRPFLLPLTKQRRARLELQLARQQRYREHLKLKKAPRRSDFASVSLEFMLVLVDHDPSSEISRMFINGIVNGLVKAGFDREQSVIRFKRMGERLPEYREPASAIGISMPSVGRRRKRPPTKARRPPRTALSAPDGM
jgi:hypothetical protein